MCLFRLVPIGDFPLLRRWVTRWSPLLLNSEIYFSWPSSSEGASDSRNLMSSDELQVLLRSEHRVGLCQWGELIIRRLRNRFSGGGFPRDFEDVFRRSEQRFANPDIFPTAMLGRPADWENVTSGAGNPMENG